MLNLLKNQKNLRKILAESFLILFTTIFFLSTNILIVNAGENYKLKSVVVLSRHNVRAPLVGGNSVLSEVTPHNWFKWTSAPSELSMRGGELEVIMGQYFRKWLTAENLITEKYLPADGEVRFYANSRQRTVATAQFFSSGMLPVANVKIERKFSDLSKRDTVFFPVISAYNEKFVALATEQVNSMFANKIPEENYRFLEKVLDFKNSAMAKKQGISQFPAEKLQVFFEPGEEPFTRGTLKTATSSAEALFLQYYEEENAMKAAFGKKLTFEDWKKISAIKDFYGDALFTAPIVAVNIAHPLLQVMNDELSLTDRKFTFLCGHDSNISSVLAALEVEDYSLPETLETKTPIGVKFVIEKRIGSDGNEYAALKLVYQSLDQIRNKTTLTLENPPVIFNLHLQGLTQNADGYYRLEDVQKRFQDAIDVYYKITEDGSRAA